ncbi:hypothetical protein Hanom_Chr15g01407331 [Helianthus anomalus]
MLRFMVNLHRFDVRCGDLAVRTFELCVTAFQLAGTIGDSGLAAASVCGGCVDFGLNFFGCVLLWLRFAGHGGLLEGGC